MSDKKRNEAGLPTATREEYLKFDGTKLGLRDYASDEVREFQKPREGFGAVVEGILETLPKYQDRLGCKGVDGVTIEKKWQRYEEITGALARVEKLAEMVRETRLALGDELLSDVYRLYRYTNAVGRDDRDVHGAFDFIREWLSLGPRPTKSATTEPPPHSSTDNR